MSSKTAQRQGAKQNSLMDDMAGKIEHARHNVAAYQSQAAALRKQLAVIENSVVKWQCISEYLESLVKQPESKPEEVPAEPEKEPLAS